MTSARHVVKITFFDIWYRNTSDIVPDAIAGDMHSMNKPTPRSAAAVGKLDNEKAWALVRSMSPVAWRHMHLNGRHGSRDGRQAIDWTVTQGLHPE